MNRFIATLIRPDIRHSIVVFFLINLCLTSSTVNAELIDRVVAVVNDDIITLSELDAEGQKLFRRIAATTPADELQEKLFDARANVLETLIDKKLIAQKAAEMNISVADEEIDAAIKDILQKSGLTWQQLLKQLQDSGVDESVYRTTIKSQLLQNKLVGADVQAKIVVTEDMVLDYYDTHYTAMVETGSYYLLQMGFTWQPENSSLATDTASLEARKFAARKRAERVHALALSGKSFEDLARNYSDLPSSEDGGDIGTFELDEMARYMRDAVARLKQGEISDIIETPSGYQFFKLLAAGEEAIVRKTSFASVKDEIKEKLFQEELKKSYAEWVKQLKEDAYIQKL